MTCETYRNFELPRHSICLKATILDTICIATPQTDYAGQHVGISDERRNAVEKQWKSQPYCTA